MRKIAVGDVMTRNFVSANPSSSLYDCAKEMAKKRVNSILITDKLRLLGILTARDILWAITKKPKANLKKIKALDIATRKVAVIKPSADISEALKKMQSLNFRRLPVLSMGEIIGIITLKDILAIEPSVYQEMQYLMDLRKERENLSLRDEKRLSDLGIYDDIEEFPEEI
jgi:CBS domain-containing protein